MSDETAELRGRVMVLEKLVTDMILKELLDVKLRSINAEATAVRAAEVVQQIASEMSSPNMAASNDEAPNGLFDVRGGVGGVRRRESKEDLDG